MSLWEPQGTAYPIIYILRGRGSPHKEKAFLPLGIGLCYETQLNPRGGALPGVWLSELGEGHIAVKNGVPRESPRLQPIWIASKVVPELSARADL